MTNPSTAKFYGLDHLRTLAILLVFFFHYRIPIFGHPGWVTDAAKFGWTGVDLFFVLSGFLISSQLFSDIKQGQHIHFRDFFVKRFFRILPAFWVVLFIYFCFPAFHEREALAPAWKYLTFTQNLGLDIQHNGTFSHAWSLCVEEHFYLFLPLILGLLTWSRLLPKGFLLLVALFVAGFFIRTCNWNHFYAPFIDQDNSWLYWYKHIYYPTYNRLDGLLVGVSIAGLFHFFPAAWSRISTYGNLLFVLSLAVLTGAYFLCEDEQSFYASVFGFPLVAVGYGLLVMSAITPSSFLFKWKSRTTTFIAMLSYGIYLSHKGVIHLTQGFFAKYGMDINSNGMLIISIAACILAALLLHLLIEKPFMKWRTKLLTGKDATR